MMCDKAKYFNMNVMCKRANSLLKNTTLKVCKSTLFSATAAVATMLRLTIFKLAFRFEVRVATNASQEQGISFLYVARETMEDFIQLPGNTFRGFVML